MKTAGPVLLFLIVALTSLGPARGESTGPSDVARDDAARARSVASMSLPGLHRRLRAHLAAAEALKSPAVADGAPASLAIALPASR